MSEFSEMINIEISIQALYDYKLGLKVTFGAFIPRFQFKHCTIIRKHTLCASYFHNRISIQALYDYKFAAVMLYRFARIFQFKHCTIIRS